MSIVDDASNVNLPAELGTVLQHLGRCFDAPSLALAAPPIKLSGGFWAEMWTLTLDAESRGALPARLVLRLAPDAALATWEAALQVGVADQGYPTPCIRAADTHPVDGLRAWCIMDHADGTPLLGGLSGVRALIAVPRMARMLPDTLARAAADLHRLDPQPIESALRQIPGRSVGVDGLLDHYLGRARQLSDTALQRSVERLAATRPADNTIVVCHGDLHPFNVLMHGHQRTVIDWTAGQVAHPAYDLAFTHLLVANPPLAAPQALRPIIGAAARRIAARFLTTYRALSPHTIHAETLDWYRALHACRIMSDLALWRADGTIDARREHPWLAIEPGLRPLVA